MSNLSQTTVAFFGATGGCAGYCLAAALNEGYKCIALVRTPAKLRTTLKEKNVNDSAIAQHLTIIEGNVKDLEAVKRTLAPGGSPVDFIVNGVGSLPKLQWSLLTPITLNDPTICQDAGKVIAEAAQQVTSTNAGGKKPLFVNVSTTGIPAAGCPRDVPLLFHALYVYGLKIPHQDKEVLEENLRQHMKLPESQRGFAGFVMVKASLLVDGEEQGLQKVREGVEETPAVGYTIRRADVGRWIFERTIKGAGWKNGWMNKSVTITS